MNMFRAFYCRTFQFGLSLGMRFLRIPLPKTKQGEGCSLTLIDDMKERGLSRPLFFIEGVLRNAGLSLALESKLKEAGFKARFFTDIKPNPTTKLVEQAKQAYFDGGCDCLIALGGGSTIDLAKAVGVVVVYPKKKIGQFAGILKIHRKIPPLFAIPTTCGTGSETTLASVIVDEEKKDKYQIDAPSLVPSYAYLDGALLAKLPKKVIAMTGMDALTHAVEAYLGRANTKFTKQCAIDAFAGIGKYLLAFYEDASNEWARNAMLKASYDAGNAFTRAFVGYVHALAHSLGGFYNVPHGFANAVLLPYVLRAYGKSINKKATEILYYLGFTYNKDLEPYEALASVVDSLNAKMGISKDFNAGYPEEDIPALAKHADKEGNPLYPVPKLFTIKELSSILKEARL